MVERRLPADPPSASTSSASLRIFLQCLQLKLGLSEIVDDVEPIFASLALYDVQAKKKAGFLLWPILSSDWLIDILIDLLFYCFIGPIDWFIVLLLYCFLPSGLWKLLLRREQWFSDKYDSGNGKWNCCIVQKQVRQGLTKEILPIFCYRNDVMTYNFTIVKDFGK